MGHPIPSYFMMAVSGETVSIEELSTSASSSATLIVPRSPGEWEGRVSRSRDDREGYDFSSCRYRAAAFSSVSP